MSTSPILRCTSVLYQSVRKYRTIHHKSKTLNLTPKVHNEVNVFPGGRFNVFNKNPRNLERLRIEYKNEGWPLEKENNTYWHKLVVKDTSKGVVVSVVHKDGDTVLSASTNEWCIRKFLFSHNDRSAYFNVGRVFARRCLETGLTEMLCTYQPSPEEKLDVLIKEIQAGGVCLSEPPRLVYEEIETKVKPERPWDVDEE